MQSKNPAVLARQAKDEHLSIFALIPRIHRPGPPPFLSAVVSVRRARGAPFPGMQDVGLRLTPRTPRRGSEAHAHPARSVALALDRVSKFHGEVRVLDRVSLEVFEGEFFTLLGPSGAGKSTILNCVTGLDQPSSGRVFLGTHDVTELPSDLRRVGMVFQDYALFPTMTVRQNVVFPLEARIQRSVLSIIRALVARREDPSIRERADRVLELVKLTGHAEKWIAQLSGGEQQRVALARALVGEPRLLCLDEPLASLDAALRRDLQTQLRSLHEHHGTTTLHVTHDQAEAFAISDRIAVIDRGRVLQIGSPKELYANPTSVFVAEFLGECNVLQIKEIAEMGC